jgi:hypothetical protein
LTTRKHEKLFEEILNAIRDSLNDLPTTDDVEDGEDEAFDEQDTELGNLRRGSEPGWVLGTTFETVLYCMVRFWQKHMRFDELTQPRRGDRATDFRKRDMKYEMAKFSVSAVVKHQSDRTAATLLPSTFEESMQTLDIATGQLQMPQVTSPPASSPMWLSSEKPQTYKCIMSQLPHMVLNSSQIMKAKSVEPVRNYHCT